MPASLEREQPQHRGLALTAAIIFLGSVASRLLGLVREQLAAGRFGAGDDIAAFTIAENAVTLLFDLTLNGMLQAALVPVLSIYALRRAADWTEFRRLTGTLVTVAVTAGIVLAFVGYLAAPRLARLFTGPEGEVERGEATFALTVTLLRLMMPALAFLLIGVVLMAALYAMKDPTGPSLGAAARNGTIVLAILLLSGEVGIRSMAYGAVAGAALLVALQFVFLFRRRALPLRPAPLRHPAIRQMGLLYLPVFAGLVVTSAGVVLDRNLAWGAEEDAVGAMRYATTLVQLVLGLVAAAVSLAILPTLAQHFGDGDEDAFRRSLKQALEFVTLFMVPAVLGLALLARPIVALLFEHGATGPDQADLIVTALLAYLPGHLLAAYDQVLIFAFYARQNTVLPVAVGIGAVAVYAVVALTLVNRYGMLGLVIANTAQLSAHTVIMAWLAHRAFTFNIWRSLKPTMIRVVAASAGMAAVVIPTWWLVNQIADPASKATWPRETVTAALPIITGLATYLFLTRLLGLDILATIWTPLRSRIHR